MFCWKCGEKIREDSLFCKVCGTRIENENDSLESTKPKIKNVEPKTQNAEKNITNINNESEILALFIKNKIEKEYSVLLKKYPKALERINRVSIMAVNLIKSGKIANINLKKIILINKKSIDFIYQLDEDSLNSIIKDSLQSKIVFSQQPSSGLRFFARAIDYQYAIIINLAIIFLLIYAYINITHINLTFYKYDYYIIFFIAYLVFVLIEEPIMLSIFGTTLGKWVFSSKIVDFEGRKLITKHQ